LAAKLNLPVAEVLTESKSAKEPGRLVFNQMMQRLYRGEAAGIICWKLDRLARNPVDGGSVIWAIKQHGIKVMTPAQSYAREDDNIILMYIEFGMAQKYVDDLSKNVKRGLKTKIENGWYPGIAPPGYAYAELCRRWKGARGCCDITILSQGYFGSPKPSGSTATVLARFDAPVHAAPWPLVRNSFSLLHKLTASLKGFPRNQVQLLSNMLVVDEPVI